MVRAAIMPIQIRYSMEVEKTACFVFHSPNRIAIPTSMINGAATQKLFPNMGGAGMRKWANVANGPISTIKNIVAKSSFNPLSSMLIFVPDI